MSFASTSHLFNRSHINVSVQPPIKVEADASTSRAEFAQHHQNAIEFVCDDGSPRRHGFINEMDVGGFSL